MSYLPWILNRSLLLHFHLGYSPARLDEVDFELDSSFSLFPFHQLWNSFSMDSASIWYADWAAFYLYPFGKNLKGERGRKSRFPLTEDIQIHLLQPLRKSGASKIVRFCSSVGIFLAKEPKVMQLSVSFHRSIPHCYVLVMLGVDLEPTQISVKISMDLQQSLQWLLMGDSLFNTNWN